MLRRGALSVDAIVILASSRASPGEAACHLVAEERDAMIAIVRIQAKPEEVLHGVAHFPSPPGVRPGGRPDPVRRSRTPCLAGRDPDRRRVPGERLYHRHPVPGLDRPRRWW